MIYIHNSALVFHGNLKSSNCVITSRWMLQITDFGLHDLRHCAESSGSVGEHQYYRSLFWKSPELLRDPNIYGTQKGDIYSFAIILYEICGRKGPFGSQEYEPIQIIELVRNLTNEEKPFRPDIEGLSESENAPEYVISCIQDCWSENPELRPDFPCIR